MPLFEDTSPAPTPAPSVTVRPKRRAIVDTRYESLRSLLTHIEGSKWVVDYYSQLGGADEELSHQEVNRPVVYQQYVRIKQLELRVTQPLSTSQDDVEKEFSLTGGANLFPGIIPNVGDMFHASLPDGRAALFTVTTARQMTILRDTTYQIEYTLVNYDNDVILADLIRKVSKDTTFVREFYAMNKSPMLVDTELSNYQQIQEWLKVLPEMYYDLFFNSDHKTFLVPEQPYKTYDPHVVNFIKKHVSTDTHPQYKNVTGLNYEGDDTEKTVFDAIYDRNIDILDYASLKLKVVPVAYFSPRVRLNSLRYSGLNYCVSSTQRSSADIRSLVASKERVYNRPFDIARFFTPDLDVGSVVGAEAQLNRAPYKSAVADDYYVFSAAFYDSVFEEMSHLESAAYLHMTSKTVAIPLVLALAKSATYWTRVEQFYYVPVVLMLLGQALRDIN